MTFETGVCKPNLRDTNIRRPPKQREYDMTSFIKAAGLAGILVEVARVAGPA
jgi:hypothetical protein